MSWTHTRALLANTKRNNPNADVTELRNQLRAERLEEHVSKTIAAGPPLTMEQARRLVGIILGGS